MHSCTAPSMGQPTLLPRAGTVCCSRAGRQPLPSARQTAARQRRPHSFVCRAEQQEPLQDEQQAEAPTSGPKFLFDEDPAPPGEGGNAQFASVFKSALSRQSGAAEQPPPPPPPPPPPAQEEPAEQSAEQQADSDEIPVAPGPKFLFDEDPAPPAAEEGGDLLSANPAFASVFKASLERSRAMREGSTSSTSSSSGSDSDTAAAAPPPAVQQDAAPEAPPAAATAPAAPPAAPAEAPAVPLQLMDPQQGGRNLPQSERQPSAAEEVLLSALRDSRRTIIALQHMHKDVADSLKREEQQFNRLHFALQKAKSDAARMAALQQMLDRRGPPQ